MPVVTKSVAQQMARAQIERELIEAIEKTINEAIEELAWAPNCVARLDFMPSDRILKEIEVRCREAEWYVSVSFPQEGPTKVEIHLS